MINVAKSFLPPIEEYINYVQGIWERGHLTNHGPLVVELEGLIKKYLGVKHFFFVSNGTVALQIAIRSLDLKGEIITTPFSYVATTSTIVWENATPVFADIDPISLSIDPLRVEEAITENTTAILATHVYGIPCNVRALESIAQKYKLKIIYDAAHAFGVEFENSSILSYGDISTLSFHATKLFHTIEGGGIATDDDQTAHRISYMRNFGHNGQEEFWGLGINGKNSEFHAAMGLCNLKQIENIIEGRKLVSHWYDDYIRLMQLDLVRPVIPSGTKYNYSYYPVLFSDEDQLMRVKKALNLMDIYPRRYFYPTLNKLPYIHNNGHYLYAESASRSVLCLPLYNDLRKEEVELICSIIKLNL